MWRNVILAAIGATGFAIIFGVRRKKLWIIFLASAVSWYLYEQLLIGTGNEYISMFFITVVIVSFAKLVGIVSESPMILFSTPILIPFIPGSTLYYAMQDLIRGDENLLSHAKLLAGQVGAMALGIAVAEMVMLVGVNRVRKGKQT